MVVEEGQDVVVILFTAGEGRLSLRCPGFSDQAGMTTRPVDDFSANELPCRHSRTIIWDWSSGGLGDFLLFFLVPCPISGGLYYC